MKKLSILLIILFFTLQIPTAISFFYNVYGTWLYNDEKYEQSVKYFEKSESEVAEYNAGNALYKMGKFQEAKEILEPLINNEKNDFQFQLAYNLGDISYRLFEKKSQIDYLHNAVDFYRKALSIRYDEEADKNLEFVLEKLREEQEKKEQQKESDSSQENQENNSENSDSEKNKHQEQNGQEGEDSENGQGNESQESGDKNGENSENGNEKVPQSGEGQNEQGEQEGAAQGDNQDSENGQASLSDSKNSQENGKVGQEGEDLGLTKQEQAALENYEKQLQNFQKEYQDSFGKVYKPSDGNPFSEMGGFEDSIFGGDPFFEDSPFGGKEEVKDW